MGAIELDLNGEELDVFDGAIDLVEKCVNSAVGVEAAVIVGRREKRGVNDLRLDLVLVFDAVVVRVVITPGFARIRG